MTAEDYIASLEKHGDEMESMNTRLLELARLAIAERDKARANLATWQAEQFAQLREFHEKIDIIVHRDRALRNAVFAVCDDATREQIDEYFAAAVAAFVEE